MKSFRAKEEKRTPREDNTWLYTCKGRD